MCAGLTRPARMRARLFVPPVCALVPRGPPFRASRPARAVELAPPDLPVCALASPGPPVVVRRPLASRWFGRSSPLARSPGPPVCASPGPPVCALTSPGPPVCALASPGPVCTIASPGPPVCAPASPGLPDSRRRRWPSQYVLLPLPARPSVLLPARPSVRWPSRLLVRRAHVCARFLRPRPVRLCASISRPAPAVRRPSPARPCVRSPLQRMRDSDAPPCCAWQRCAAAI